jgi:hypothetical protein
MRYMIGFFFLALQLLTYKSSAFAQTPKPVFISPNAQTGLVSNIVFSTQKFLQFNGMVDYVFDFNGAYISELSTISITADIPWCTNCEGHLFTWTNLTGYGSFASNAGPFPVSVTVDKTKITLSGGNYFPYPYLRSVSISGVRCNVVPLTHGINPGSPLTVSLYFAGSTKSKLADITIATFADPIDSQLKAEPAYTWSNGFWNASATIRILEAGSFSDAFETQSIGSSNDATQVILTLWGMPKSTRLKKAIVANTTSVSVAAAVSPKVIFPLSGSPVRVPINIFGQSAEKLENIDITLTFEIVGVAEKIPSGSVTSTVTLGPQAPDDSNVPIPFDSVPGAGIGGNRYLDNQVSSVSVLNVIDWPMDSVNISLSAGGAATFDTTGESQASQVGYAAVARVTGADPYGTAVVSFRQNGVTVTEVGVPATSPTTRAWIFIDYRSNVNAIPARSGAGTVDVNTGIAIENNGSATANVTYTLRDLNGDILTTGHGTILGGYHFAKFINQLKEIASDFNLPSNFQNATQFGSLEIASDQPISVLALRATTNQRDEFLITTLPIADLNQEPSYDPTYFPQLADGGGFATSLLLLNTSGRTESGTMQIFDNNGAPLVVNQAGGKADSSFIYSIPPGGGFRFQTDGYPAGTRVGWVRMTPDLFSPMPVGSGVFTYNPGSILISESGVPATIPTNHARVYVDLSGSHNTGLAIANVANTAADIKISAYQTDGVTNAGTNQGSLQLPIGGHDAKFADQFISGLPAGFKGILDISSGTLFAALTVRSLVNERNDFLMTCFPVASTVLPAPWPLVFPQIADGGGWVTEFILFSAGRASTVMLSFYGEDGTPLASIK